uniref:Germin-like protein n=1 Tax=Setaria viridis TaxID=4556 RepID=A0A4U6U9T9_SETVI|nr:hypothetical protein SEVIR_6G180000v2 [Setaria viridis]
MAPKAAVLDFCVANLLLPDTPSGYPCKPKPAVTADDFHCMALAQAGPTIAPFNTGLATATVKQFPGVNGLGLAATRVDVHVGGVVPLHSHPEGSELLFVFKGSMTAGFISAESNEVYVKEVREGELFVFPQGLLHFQYNTGNETAVGFAAYSSDNPGLQITDYALFGNTLTAEDARQQGHLHRKIGGDEAQGLLRSECITVVNKVTFMSIAEILKLIKVFFGLSAVPPDGRQDYRCSLLWTCGV